MDGVDCVILKVDSFPENCVLCLTCLPLKILLSKMPFEARRTTGFLFKTAQNAVCKSSCSRPQLPIYSPPQSRDPFSQCSRSAALIKGYRSSVNDNASNSKFGNAQNAKFGFLSFPLLSLSLPRFSHFAGLSVVKRFKDPENV